MPIESMEAYLVRFYRVTGQSNQCTRLVAEIKERTRNGANPSSSP